MDVVTVSILAAAGANAVVIIGGLSLWLGHRARRAPRPEELRRLTETMDARLAELTRAVDVIAVEVERIADAQRCLMLERQSAPPIASPPSPDAPRAVPGRIITPH